jgi:hypothetical protein
VTDRVTAANVVADDPQRIGRPFGFAGGVVVAVALGVAVGPVWIAAGSAVALLAVRYGGPYAFVFGTVALVAADVSTVPWAFALAEVGLLVALLGPAVATDRPVFLILTFALTFGALVSVPAVWTLRPGLPAWLVLAVLGLAGATLALGARRYAARVLPDVGARLPVAGDRPPSTPRDGTDRDESAARGGATPRNDPAAPDGGARR